MDSLAVTARKIADLRIWEKLDQRQFALKPKGIYPYFVTIITTPDSPLIEASVLILEGWQCFHDFMHFRLDRNYGFIQSPMELAGYEFLYLRNGLVRPVRHDPGFVPTETFTPKETELLQKLVWEVYGICLRLDTDSRFLLQYAAENALFGRTEQSDGRWTDTPFPIVPAHPHMESISIEKALFKKAKDLAFEQERFLEVAFYLNPRMQTLDPKPRLVYNLVGADNQGVKVIDRVLSSRPETGLRGMWETMPQLFMRQLIESVTYLPGEIKVGNARMFRMLRPLCTELPFKLSLHDKLQFISPLAFSTRI